jgi:hypothetical protein
MLPVWPKLAYTTYVAVLVPAYVRQYGPGNFLWFSDVALLLGCAAIWLEHPLLTSTQAVAVVVPDVLWTIEFTARVVTGARLTGLTDYMFDRSIPAFVRALSLFHVWLPIALVWMVWRVGYDARALLLQTIVGSVVLAASYLFTDPRENVNSVHRWGTIRGVSALAVSAIIFPFTFYLPAHLAFRVLMPPAVVP